MRENWKWRESARGIFYCCWKTDRSMWRHIGRLGVDRLLFNHSRASEIAQFLFNFMMQKNHQLSAIKSSIILHLVITPCRKLQASALHQPQTLITQLSTHPKNFLHSQKIISDFLFLNTGRASKTHTKKMRWRLLPSGCAHAE